MIQRQRRQVPGHPGLCLLVVVSLALMLSCAGTGKEEEEPNGTQAAGETPAIDPGVENPPGSSAPAANSIRTLIVEIYFPSAEETGLIAEAREIFATSAPGDRAKQIVADLISGPVTDRAVRGLPRATRLRQIYVLEDGVAYLDFSDELRDGLGGGSSAELLAIYSIVDSVVLNVPEIRRVGFLIKGEPVETLNGHLNLRKPLRPDSSLIVGRVASQPGGFARNMVAVARVGNVDPQSQAG